MQVIVFTAILMHVFQCAAYCTFLRILSFIVIKFLVCHPAALFKIDLHGLNAC